jgi:1-aminocyclopropane-1-carboxylate deaminase/D-cysteine desulfhydrase-like pyridoxal-dependent ACC family enzyme
MRCVLVLNGVRPEHLTGNALLQHLLGAEIRYVASREERASAVQAELERLRAEGRRPYHIPVGASVPLGALGYTLAVGELRQQAFAPDVIVHATGSAGTQAGLVAGCAIFGLPSRVLAIAADEPVPALRDDALELLRGIARLLGVSEAELADERVVEVDGEFVAPGYGVPSPASEEAMRLCARTEGLFLDPVYTAKAMAGLIAHVRAGRFREDETVLFWHTGGLPALFA